MARSKGVAIVGRSVVVVVLSILASTCGGGTSTTSTPAPTPMPSPAAPSPTPAPTPEPEPAPVPTPPRVVRITGMWAGNLEASNAATRAITMTLNDAAGCVDGSWQSSTGEWKGVVSGSTFESTFDGLFNLIFTDSRGKSCTGVAKFTGPVTDTTLRWTSVGFEGDCTGMPANVILTVERR